MLSLEDSKISIINPEINRAIKEVDFLLKQIDNYEISIKGPKLIALLNPLIKYFTDKAPPIQNWQSIGIAFNKLCAENKQVYYQGIEYEWLHTRMDCAKYPFYDLPFHSRIGIGHHAGNAAIEEWFLLDDAFFLLAATEIANHKMKEFAHSLEGSTDKNDKSIYRAISTLNQNTATFARTSVISYMAFVESFVNSVANDYMRRNVSSIDNSDLEILSGRKKGRFLSLEYKFEKYPEIISHRTNVLHVIDPSQREEPFKVFFEKYKNQRDSAVHYSPGKEPLLRAPHEWFDLASSNSITTIDVAKRFWHACYPERNYPRYLLELNYDTLKNRGAERASEVF
jgi:hypothetical protein